MTQFCLTRNCQCGAKQECRLMYFSDFSRKRTIKFNDLNIVSKNENSKK